MMHTSLFEGPNLRLTATNPEEDSKIEARWTYDLDYSRDILHTPARPLGALELKKVREEELKKNEDSGRQFVFAIHLKEGDQLAGFVRFPSIFWVHSSAWLRLAIADTSILKRFGREALEMALMYGFRELNLYRIETAFAAYQQDWIDLFEGAGFLMEVRRRQVVFHNGNYWDALHFGLLQDEWKPAVQEAAA